MSRIGRQPIAIPAGVTVQVSESNLVTVKGPKGTLSQQVNPDIKLEMKDGTLTLTVTYRLKGDICEQREILRK